MLAFPTMAAELEKLARQFLVSGNEDIAEGILAWSAIAKSRGFETFSATPVRPEGAVRLPDLTIGGKTVEELERDLTSTGFGITDWAEEILLSPDFTVLPEQQTLSLVRVRVSDLGLTGNPATEQIYARANYMSFDLCPAEVGPQLRLAYKDQPPNESLFVGMKPVANLRGLLGVFRLDRLTSHTHMWLNSRGTRSITQWNPSDEFVFSISK